MMGPRALMKTRAMNVFATPEARDAAVAHVEEAAAMYGPGCRAPTP
jgi:hypothetical protein